MIRQVKVILNFARRVRVSAILIGVVSLALAISAESLRAFAQEGDSGSAMSDSMHPSAPDVNPDRPPPMHRVPLPETLTGSMMVTPPYGNAPLRVGFFVLADDPANIGFLTYQWNFGDGTVSSLPPELYIFHTYANPGNYLCSLVIKTVDGRSKTFFQGVIVSPTSG
jgi:hypothetical protein